MVVFILADSRRFLFRNVENKPSLETWAVTFDCTATKYEPKVSILLSHKASVATLPKTKGMPAAAVGQLLLAPAVVDPEDAAVIAAAAAAAAEAAAWARWQAARPWVKGFE